MNKHRKSRYDPSYGMGRTHSFAPGMTGIDTGTAFPIRLGDITISVTIAITTDTPAGVIFHLGTGLAVWIRSADRKLMAAMGDAADANGVTLEGPVCGEGRRYRIILSGVPSVGKARLWVDGHLVTYKTATGGGFPNGWSNDGPGAVGAIDTAVTTRVAEVDRISLADASVVSVVSVFRGQRPRQFYEVS